MSTPEGLRKYWDMDQNIGIGIVSGGFLFLMLVWCVCMCVFLLLKVYRCFLGFYPNNFLFGGCFSKVFQVFSRV